MLALKIQESQALNTLYEGLIYTYSLRDTIKSIIPILSKYKFKYNIHYSEEVSLPYIQIITNGNNDILSLKNIDQRMENCGWYIIDIVNHTGTHYHTPNYIKNMDKIRNIDYVVYRAKFDIEVDQKQWPDFLYHVTPSKNLNKILRNGLVPKSESKLSSHKDHIYLYDIRANDFTLEDLIKTLDENRIKKDFIKDKENEYVILKIDMKFQRNGFRLFADPDLNNSYFTINNIDPNSIEAIDTIII